MPELANVDVEAFQKTSAGSIKNDPPGKSLLTVGRVLWPTLLSLAVVGLIAALTFDVRHFRETLQQLNPWYLGAAVGSVIVRVLLGGWRLSYVSHGHLRLAHGIRGQLAWDFFSNITPSAIGGGPVAAIFIARDRGIAVGEASAIMLFSMLLDQLLFALMVPVLLITMTFLPVLPTSLGSVGQGAFVLLFLGLMAWVFTFGYAVLFRPDLLQRAAIAIFRIKWLRRYRDRVVSEMNQLRERTRILRTQPASFFLIGFLMTAGTWLARFILPLLIVMSVFPDVERALLFIRTIAMSISTIILPTPGGSGGIEGLYALFVGPMIPASLMAPTLLTWRVLAYYVFLLVGVYLSMHHVQKTVRRNRRNGTKH